MKRQLKESRVLITGASSGIGRALALEFANLGSRIAVMARREDRLVQLQSAIEPKPGIAVVVVGDVSCDSDREHAINMCVDQFGGLDVLINNAGIGAIGDFADATPERLRQIMDVNFTAPVELIRLALPLLKQSRGAIANIGSVLGHRAVPQKSEYCASKFAMHGFSDALRAEVARDGVDVTLISPSTVDSEFFDSVIDGKPKSQRRGIPAAKVAQATIRAIRNRKSEIILPFEGKLLVLADRVFPTLVNRILAQRS